MERSKLPNLSHLRLAAPTGTHGDGPFAGLLENSDYLNAIREAVRAASAAEANASDKNSGMLRMFLRQDGSVRWSPHLAFPHDVPFLDIVINTAESDVRLKPCLNEESIAAMATKEFSNRNSFSVVDPSSYDTHANYLEEHPEGAGGPAVHVSWDPWNATPSPAIAQMQATMFGGSGVAATEITMSNDVPPLLVGVGNFFHEAAISRFMLRFAAEAAHQFNKHADRKGEKGDGLFAVVANDNLHGCVDLDKMYDPLYPIGAPRFTSADEVYRRLSSSIARNNLYRPVTAFPEWAADTRNFTFKCAYAVRLHIINLTGVPNHAMRELLRHAAEEVRGRAARTGCLCTFVV